MTALDHAPATRVQPEPLRARTRPPVVYWAVVGAAFVALAAYIFIAWFATGEATAAPKGPDPLPSSTEVWVWVITVAGFAVGPVAVWHAVRTSRREGRLSFDAMLLVAWVAVLWQDPLMNYVRPIGFWNADIPNLGSWSERIPGWITPRGANMPEPLFLWGLYPFFVIVTVGACGAMRRAKERWSGLSPASVVVAGFAAMTLLNLVVELFLVHTGVYAYPGVVHGLSIWGGETYQLPIYESMCFGALFAAAGALRYFRDDRGRSIVERGVDDVRTTPGRRNALRILAICGFLNVAFIATYNLPWNWFGMHADKTPEYPSYLRAELCGDDTPYRCPGPDVPIYLPESPHS